MERESHGDTGLRTDGEQCIAEPAGRYLLVVGNLDQEAFAGRRFQPPQEVASLGLHEATGVWPFRRPFTLLLRWLS